MEQGSPITPERRYRLLLRGESLVASVGITVAAILLGMMAALAWWTVRTQRAFLDAARANEVRAVGEVLAESVEHLLEGESLSAARRMVADAAQEHTLSVCRVVLPDGKIVADAEPSAINLPRLPASWLGGDDPDATPLVTTPGPGLVVYSHPLSISNRGMAKLEISAAVTYPSWVYWRTQTGLGAIGAAALFSLLLVYRHLRRRLRAIGTIREVLLQVREGESVEAALAVSEELGVEAAAWNQILAERQNLRKQMLVERARGALGSRRTAKGELDAAFDALSQGLLLVDQDGRVKHLNGAAAVFLRAKRDEAVGADIATLIQEPELVEAIRGVVSGTARRKTTLDIERQGDGGAGGVLRFSIRPVRREDQAAAMIVIEDITQQRVVQESRNAFVAQATHELRTPLTNIRLYVETAIEDGEKDPALRNKCLNVINQETRRLERLVGEMLSISELEAGSFKLMHDDVRLDALFAELQDDFEAQAKDQDLQFALDLPPKLPVIKGDRDKITLALHNLVGNAIKYTPKGGQVRVRVEVSEKELTVNVTDTGIGISEEETERIFERFYRARDERVTCLPGTGLGLALTREVVRLHGGEITVSSQLNKGSTFTVKLPTRLEAA